MSLKPGKRQDGTTGDSGDILDDTSHRGETEMDPKHGGILGILEKEKKEKGGHAKTLRGFSF